MSGCVYPPLIVVSRYVSRGRPLTGYFIVCCVVEAQWTVLAQALGRAHSAVDISSAAQEAEAANVAWQKLLKYHEPGPGLTDSKQKVVLLSTMKNAMQTFTTLLVQIQEMDSDPADDSYAWETMSESLVSSRDSGTQLQTDRVLETRGGVLCCPR